MPPPLICETIAAPTMAALRARRDAVTHGDLVELRLDLVDRPDVAGALQGRTRPALITCRAPWEGGGFTGSEEERQRLLAEALASGAEFVDIEWKTAGLERWLRPSDLPRIVLSHHVFDETPSDLIERASSMRSTGAGVVKVATFAKSLGDLERLLWIGAAQGRDARSVVIGMGPRGVASRILAAHFNCCWTYAGEAVAPGQIPSSRLLEEFRFRSITPATAIYAVVGHPIGHSLSPAMHNAAFAAAGIDAVYVPCETDDLSAFAALADVLPIVGASVTAPLKQAAFESSHPADPLAARVESVNTLRGRPSAAWEGRNTDIAGFLAPLESRLTLHGARVAVLGAGGAARGIVFGLGASGARVTVHARDAEAAARVASLAPGGTAGPWSVPRGSWDLLVNTTPIGTAPHVEETPFTGPFDGQLVYDLVYNPRPTRLLRDAAAAGCETLDGLEMLVQQAVRQFAWWTGITPDAAIMRAAAEGRVGTASTVTAGESESHHGTRGR